MKLKKYVLIISFCLIMSLVPSDRVKAEDGNSIGKIAIVIDDFGNNSEGTEAMLKMDIPITAAIMPFMPSTVKDMEMAKKNNKEIIIHMPMEPERGKASWLGPKAIITTLKEEEIRSRIDEAITELSYAVGMNNHMGSKVLQDERVMKNILEILKSKELYYLDSKTTPKSLAKKLCNDIGVKHYERNIFLDNIKDVGSIERQLEKAAMVAKKEGYAIAIGHVGPEGGSITVKAINNKKQEFKARGIEFIFLSQIPKRD